MLIQILWVHMSVDFGAIRNTTMPIASHPVPYVVFGGVRPC